MTTTRTLALLPFVFCLAWSQSTAADAIYTITGKLDVDPARKISIEFEETNEDEVVAAPWIAPRLGQTYTITKPDGTTELLHKGNYGFYFDDAVTDTLQFYAGADQSPPPPAGTLDDLNALSPGARVTFIFFNAFDSDGSTISLPTTVDALYRSFSDFPSTFFSNFEVYDDNAEFSGHRRFYISDISVSFEKTGTTESGGIFNKLLKMIVESD